MSLQRINDDFNWSKKIHQSLITRRSLQNRITFFQSGFLVSTVSARIRESILYEKQLSVLIGIHSKLQWEKEKKTFSLVFVFDLFGKKKNVQREKKIRSREERSKFHLGKKPSFYREIFVAVNDNENVTLH